MPHVDPERHREYQREWQAGRRASWFKDKSCVECGGTEQLELDHRDPALKVGHNVWSWREDRRLAELAKCDVRCAPCHHERHGRETRRHGINRYEKGGCRCDICKAAKATKNRRYRERREARPVD